MPTHPTPFALGVDAGRIVPQDFVAPEGTHVLSAGSDRPLQTAARIGEDLVWEQSIDFTGETVLRHALIVRGSSRMPLLSLPGVFVLADGQTLLVAVDGDVRTVTFNTGDFVDITMATALEVLLQVVAQLGGQDIDGRIERDERFSIRTRSLLGKESILVVTGGTAAATLGLRDLAWTYELRVGGTQFGRRIVRPGDSRTMFDVGVALVPIGQPATYQLALRIEDLDSVGDDGALIGSVEMPGVYIDALGTDDINQAFLLNRDPEPDETIVRVGRVRYVDCCSGAGPVDVSSIEVDVVVGGDLEPALSGGVFSSPWDGPGSSVTSISTHQIRVCLDRTTELPGSTIVEVVVRFETTDFTPIGFDDSYEWTTEDLVAPIVSETQAVDVRLWRVRFNEPVIAETCVETNFSVEALETLIVTPLVIGCQQLEPDLVELSLDLPASFGRRYEIVVQSAEDLNNNESGVLRAEIVALRPESEKADRLTWFDMVAPGHLELSRSGDLNNLTTALDELLEQMVWRVGDMRRLISVDQMPDGDLDKALVGLGGVPIKMPLTAAQKRLLLAGTLRELYRQQGTRRGMERAIRVLLGIEAEIFSPYKDGFVVAESEIGGDDLLGSGTASEPLEYGVRVFVALTDDERVLVERLARRFQYAPEIFLRVEEPEPPAAGFIIVGEFFVNGLEVL